MNPNPADKQPSAILALVQRCTVEAKMVLSHTFSQTRRFITDQDIYTAKSRTKDKLFASGLSSKRSKHVTTL